MTADEHPSADRNTEPGGSPANGSDETRLSDGLPPSTPRKIGHFTIKSLIGFGGMASVYLAVQEHPRRRVALKLMKSGIASRSALRRFEFESQILGRLRHPHIAQVYEAGTHDTGEGGVPYFAMEYIPNARPITEYARTRELGTRQRLELFAKVCDAVHHGHQKGIIHRDLKPGNMLVDSAGEPKVIDFGVARSTDSDMAVTTLQTDIGQLIGTVQYMSPEQCDADPDDLDIRSDVYALGVVLYELLTDRLPYDVTKVAVYEAARVIKQESPPKPSTLDRALRGDVETITLKAMEKERERRYASAAELARDIQRYLNDEPIEARPPSLFYQIRVFARRNRIAFGAALSVAAVLVVATVISAIFAFRAEASRRQAEIETVNAQFRLRSAREELAEAVDELNRLLWLTRRSQDLSYFAPEHIRSQYPEITFTDFDVWLAGLLPELGPTDPGSEGRPAPLPAPVLELLSSHLKAPDDRRNEPLYDWVRRNRARLQQLADGIDERDPVLRTRWRLGRSLIEGGGFLPPLAARVHAGKLLGAHAVANHLDGRHEDAAQALRAQRTLARATGSSGNLMTSVMAMGLRERTYTLTRWMILDALRRGEGARWYIRFAIEDPPLPPMDAAIRIEALVVRQAVRELFVLREKDGRPTLDPRMWEEMSPLFGGSVNEAEVLEADLQATLRALDSAVEASLVGANEPGAEMRSPLAPEIEAMANQEGVLKAFVPTYAGALRLRARVQMERDATIITAALAAHRAEHGAWPADVDEALADFPAPPLRRDYYGHDFVYRVEGGEPVLYAVGENQSDDGGDPSGQPPHDHVFLRPRPFSGPGEGNPEE